MDLQGLVEELARAQLVLASRTEDAKDAQEDVEATPEHQTLSKHMRRMQESRTEVNELTGRVRATAVEVYCVTGEKKPAPGIGIRQSEALTYDAERALKYCRRKVQNALRFDKREFEKIARLLRPKWVQFDPKTTATIAKDLPGALAKARKGAEDGG